MFEELSLLLQNEKNRSDQAVGRILDFLKKIDHFKKMDDHLGSQYLVSLLPVLHPFILREGFNLINEADHYVLVEGDLRARELQYGSNRPFQIGRYIDLRENSHLCFFAASDCKMVRISKGAGVHNIQQKKIYQAEIERRRKMNSYQELIKLPLHQEKMQIIRENSFLTVLGNYDVYQLALGSQLKEYPQSAATHELNEKVQKIGYIVSGKIKLTFSDETKRKRGNEITWLLNEKDWIGLEQFLWKQNYKSSGEVSTIGAIIMWVPCELFSSKFNEKLNNDAISRLISLTKTKQILFERSFNCRTKKQEQMQLEKASRQKVSAELLKKMSILQMSEGIKKKDQISRARLKAEKKAVQLPMPNFMFHKSKNLQDDPIVLPRIQDKITFFPEQYETAPISPIHKKELSRLRMAMGIEKSVESFSTIELNPQNLYKTIYSKIAYRFVKRHAKSTPRQYPREQRKITRFNESIYNNFKVGRQKGEEHLHKNKTLAILPFQQ